MAPRKTLTSLLLPILVTAYATKAVDAQVPSHAVGVETGAWTGHVLSPDGRRTDATFTLSGAGGNMGVTIEVEEFGSFAATKVRLMGDELSFEWEPGQPLREPLGYVTISPDR